MKNLVALVAGILFSLGLILSGMTRPSKVQGFLDIFGNWDPSLLFVMGGAILVHGVSYRWIKRMPRPVLDSKFYLPDSQKLTPALVIGSSIFGIGWGLGGYCPGPALVSLASLQWRPIEFVVAMIAGMFLFQAFNYAYPIKR
jgi:uncharacterized membrane protein YedE/YeeE